MVLSIALTAATCAEMDACEDFRPRPPTTIRSETSAICDALGRQRRSSSSNWDADTMDVVAIVRESQTLGDTETSDFDTSPTP